MVTEKDTKAVAEIIEQETSRINPLLWFVPTKILSERLADYFATQKPRFDRGKFLKACGL